MTSTVYPISLTYAGQDLLSSDLGLLFRITSGLGEPPSVRGHDVLVPGLPGLVSRNRVNDHLDITLLGHVMGNGIDTAARRSDYRTKVRLLRTLFAADRAPADLVVGLEDGSTWTISARPADPPLIWTMDELVMSEFDTVSVGLYSVEADWTTDT